MGFLFITGLVLTTATLWTFDLFEDDDATLRMANGDDQEGSPSDDMPPSTSQPDDAPDNQPDAPADDDLNQDGGDDMQPDATQPDTGASMIETEENIILQSGADETGSFLAIRVLATGNGPIEGEVNETAWLDFYLVPEDTVLPTASGDWIGAGSYEARAEAIGLHSLGRVSLGSVILDLDSYIADGSKPSFLDSRIPAPDIIADRPITMLALEGAGSADNLEIDGFRATETLDPAVPGEGLVWRIARSSDGTDWDFDLARVPSGTTVDGSGEDDTILIAPFENADISIIGGGGEDEIEIGIGPDVNGGPGADNIILTVPEYIPADANDPRPEVSEIALADSADRLGIVLPDASEGPVFAVNLTETSGGGNIIAMEYSLVLIQTAPGSAGPPEGDGLSALLREGRADGVRILAQIQLGAELVTTKPDGSTSAIGVRNEAPQITYAGTLAGSVSATLPAMA